MKTLTYTKAHNLAQLHGELLALVPALRPVAAPGERYPVAVFSLQGVGDEITLCLFDDPDEATAGVVAAQAPADAPPPAPTAADVIAALAVMDLSKLPPEVREAIEPVKAAAVSIVGAEAST